MKKIKKIASIASDLLICLLGIIIFIEMIFFPEMDYKSFCIFTVIWAAFHSAYETYEYIKNLIAEHKRPFKYGPKKGVNS